MTTDLGESSVDVRLPFRFVDLPSPAVHTEELILYATPLGPFAEACDEYWSAAEAFGVPTTAQTYPPHCSLTGFFHRSAQEVGRIAAEVGGVVHGLDEEITTASAELRVIDDWVGFVLGAPVFDRVIEDFVGAHVVADGEDALRPKHWLHLSLAYGDGVRPAQHHDMARRVFGCRARSTWSVGLWRRRRGRWSRIALNTTDSSAPTSLAIECWHRPSVATSTAPTDA